MSKHVIITGTSSGIGFEMVKLFAEQGHQVLALSRNKTPVVSLNLSNVTAFSFDLCDETNYDRVVNFIQSKWHFVDLLINNAGTLLNKSFIKTTFKDFESVYKTNVFGVSELTRVALPYIKPDGHVVTVSSMGGIQGSAKFPGLAAYSSSKGAVITLTELLAEEYKKTGPQFNVLALGAVQTEMLKKAFPNYEAPITAIDMARYIMRFALNGNKYYNGKVLQVSNTTP